MITVLQGSTYRMLIKDERVASMTVEGTKVEITLAAPYFYGNMGVTTGTFENWESARNWVRKAEKQERLLA